MEKLIMDSATKILITGFERFGEFESNPSQTLVEALNKEPFKIQLKEAGFDVHAHVLPVEYNKAFESLKVLIEKQNPQIVLSFGVAQNREKICLERIAVNHRSILTKDNSGLAPDTQSVLEGGPDGVFSNITDLDELSMSLNEKGWRVRVSLTAGDYVCNALMYEACLLAKEKGFAYDFIHIPKEELSRALNMKKIKSLPYFVMDLLELLT